MLHTILVRNKDYFTKQNKQADICNGIAVVFVFFERYKLNIYVLLRRTSKFFVERTTTTTILIIIIIIIIIIMSRVGLYATRINVDYSYLTREFI
jgi:hypothetical protein